MQTPWLKLHTTWMCIRGKW